MALPPEARSGLDAAITRRDFLNGVPVAVGAPVGGILPEFIGAAVADGQMPQDAIGYPPAAIGLRGDHPGSFETAHALRDPGFWQQAGPVTPTGEDYDLVIVGGGISGLAAAHFYRARLKSARILVLDNHDDFGGHAKRNEFATGGRVTLMNGGTFSIDSPRPYSKVADGLLKTLGVDPVALTKKCADRNFYASLDLARGIFFDRETFGADKLVTLTVGASWSELLAASPLPPKARDPSNRDGWRRVSWWPSRPGNCR
jgi:spermidine dehydrogenase